MAYSIVESSASAFVANKMALPRFQRKQTWQDAANFKLCISVFKGYPIGVVIVNELGSKICLLDGRQRRNALKRMSEDPVQLYNWARAFLKIKPQDSEADVRAKFYEIIDIYLQNEFNKATGEEINLDDDIDYIEQSFDASIQTENLGTLLEMILLVHGRYKGENQFVGHFKFDGIVPASDLDYSVPVDGEYRVNSVRLKQYIKTLISNGETDKEAFLESLRRRYKLDAKALAKLTKFMENHWDYFERCFEVIEKADKVILNSKIGMIRLMNATTLDAQNIFSLVNGEGSKLTAEELLSARPFWNYQVENPSDDVRREAKTLYRVLNVDEPDDVVRWDLCATLISRIDKNHIVFPVLDIRNATDFTKKLTLGFKLVSGIFTGGISSLAVTDLEKGKKNTGNIIDWNVDIERLVFDYSMVFALLEDCDFFKYLQAWKQSVTSLLGSTIALEFAILLYKRWHAFGKPNKSNLTKVRELQRDAIILFDRLAFEYASKMWSGSSNTRVVNDLKSSNERFSLVSTDKWTDLFNEIASGNFDGPNGASKALLYYYYCLKKVIPTISDQGTTYEVDHILSQDQFALAPSVDRVWKDNLFNLAVLPKKENISKGNHSIQELSTQGWLFEQVKKYAEIDDTQVALFSDISNIEQLIQRRRSLFEAAFQTDRITLLNNI